MSQAHLRLMGALLLLAIGAYYLPWGWHPTAGLSPGARDLAEWTTLHPEARAAAPALLPSFCLRVIPGLLAMLLALYATGLQGRLKRWGVGVLSLLLALSLLPPLEWLTVARADPNYQQQFGLCLLALITSGGLMRWGTRFPAGTRYAGSIGLCLAGIACAAVGTALGLSLINSLGVSVRLGIGSALFAGMLSTIGLINVRLARAHLRTRNPKIERISDIRPS